MSHTARSLLLLVAFFSLCSCGGEPPQARADRAALVNGALDAGDPAVVAIVYRLPASHAPASMAVCTGVLLANRVVVTAAHCVAEAHQGPFDVFFGSELAHGGEVIPIETISVHPGYEADTHVFDVALVRIAWDARVAPLEIASDAADWLVPGNRVRAVGFGVDGKEGDFPDQKRDGHMLVTEVDSEQFDTVVAPDMTCTGDSGGPLLALADTGEERLVGLTVSGDAGCREVAHNQRLDTLELDFVAPFVAAKRDTSPGCGLSRPVVPSNGAALVVTSAMVIARRRRARTSRCENRLGR